MYRSDIESGGGSTRTSEASCSVRRAANLRFFRELSGGFKEVKAISSLVRRKHPIVFDQRGCHVYAIGNG